MNTVILDPATEDGFLFADTLAQEEGYDPFSAMISSARAAGMYVYAIYDLRLAADGSLVDAAFISNAVQGCADFADRYDLDGVLLTGYYTSETLDGYQQYLSEGSGIGYENYLYESTGQLLRLAAQTMRGKMLPIYRLGCWRIRSGLTRTQCRKVPKPAPPSSLIWMVMWICAL